jgi:hypothetical protein
MSFGSPSTFSFHDALPEATLDPAWRALIRQQGRTLAAMLSRAQATVTVVPHAPEAHSSNASRLQTLAAQA